MKSRISVRSTKPFCVKFFCRCVMVASLFSMLFKCVSPWQEGVSLWLVICHYDMQKMFSHFTLVLELELSSVLETCITAGEIDKRNP